jgi:hypothetical protein
MNRSIAFAAMAGAALTLSACATHGPQSGLVVANVTVVSPERARPLEHAYVRILDGRIAELSERPLRGAEEIDGSGRYLIPGLIDSHVHLAVAPGFPAPMTAAQAAAHPELVAAALDQDPRSSICCSASRPSWTSWEAQSGQPSGTHARCGRTRTSAAPR